MSIRTFKTYSQLRKEQAKEINNFPITYIFGDLSPEKLKEHLDKIGAKCLAECTSMYGAGDVVRKVDVPKWGEMCLRHSQELQNFITSSSKNAEDAFYTEMCNHEYGYTMNTYEVLSALNMDNSILNGKLLEAWKRAEKRCISDTF